jgi:hypothetical protein
MAVSAAITIGVVTLGLSPLAGRLVNADTVLAQNNDGEATSCPVPQQTLKAQLIAADASDATGLDNHYWAVVVNRAGVVCAVAYSGPTADAQWLLSRQIAAA